jgi:hypothetical protein
VSRSYTNLTADSASQDYTATPDPTVISLVSFTAQAGSKYVKLAWTTGSEVDTAGFYIWKASSKDGDYQRLNSSIIPAAGLAPSGASYSCMDASIGNGETCYYMLEDVDMAGHSTFHGPVSASAGTSAILSFKAIPTDIFKGGISTLSWITSGNPTLYLNETALSGWSLGVSPNLTTSYTLRDDLGDAILVTVTVKPFALIDMAGLAKAWGSASGDAAYDPCYDLNGDGIVDDADVGLCFTDLQ